MEELISKINNVANDLALIQKIKLWHEFITSGYPECKLRWANIHGKRWSHIWPQDSEIFLGQQLIQINERLGIIVDNQTGIEAEELRIIVRAIQKVSCYAE